MMYVWAPVGFTVHVPALGMGRCIIRRADSCKLSSTITFLRGSLFYFFSFMTPTSRNAHRVNCRSLIVLSMTSATMRKCFEGGVPSLIRSFAVYQISSAHLGPPDVTVAKVGTS